MDNLKEATLQSELRFKDLVINWRHEHDDPRHPKPAHRLPGQPVRPEPRQRQVYEDSGQPTFQGQPGLRHCVHRLAQADQDQKDGAALSDTLPADAEEWRSLRLHTSDNTGYMCIRTSIVKKNHIMWDAIEYIPEEEYIQRIQRKKPEKGDVVYTREGAILGIAAVIDRDCDVALGQRSMLLSPAKSICTPEFLSMAMNTDSFLRNALRGMSGSASPHINVGDIKDLKMIMPPFEIQKEFSAFVAQVDKSKSAMQQSLAKMEENHQSLTQKCFRGEIF